MIVSLASVLTALILVEVALRGFNCAWLRGQQHRLKEELQAFFNATGDDERQRLILLSARSTLLFSLSMFALIGILAIIAGLPVWSLALNKEEQTAYLIMISVAATAWWLIRPKLIRAGNTTASPETTSQAMLGSNYSKAERWLHWLALESLAVRRLSFDIERRFFLQKDRKTQILNDYTTANGPVYVCGLARSGTTIILRILYQIEVFRSLSYRDMPFVLAPNLWKRLTSHSKNDITPAERAHGDSLIVDADSPEAFEEVFWRTFDIKNDNARCFGGQPPTKEALAAFADYRSVIANPRTQTSEGNTICYRYLSKNNNNLLRLDSLCADPTATVLLVYRNPLATAHSLYIQHKRFCEAHREDKFTQQYMEWLGHHEFGLGHLPFCFAVAEMEPSLDSDDPNYWLNYWNAVHQYLLTKLDLRIHLINHDVLRAQPVHGLEFIFTILGINDEITKFAHEINPPRKELVSMEVFAPLLVDKAKAIHSALLNSPRNLLH